MSFFKKNKKLTIIICIILVLLIAAGGIIWALWPNNDSKGNKKKPIIIINSEEILDVIDDIDIDTPDGEVDISDQKDYGDDIEDVDNESVIHYLKVNNKKSVNDSFMGFGATYYPWIYWEDSAGRNYTEEQRQIELDRLAESGITWIRSVIYARSEWYNNNTKQWSFKGKSGNKYEGLLKFFQEIQKRNIEVLLNFEWGGDINADKFTFNDNTLTSYANSEEELIDMYGKFCAAFTKQLSDDGITCVKYITFFSEPSNSEAWGGQYGSPEFEDKYLKIVVPRYANCVKAVDEEFNNLGIRKNYKFLGCNTSSYIYINGYTYEQFKPIWDACDGYLDELTYHFYLKTDEPSQYSYDDFNYMSESMAATTKKAMGISPNNTWIDETSYIGEKLRIHEVREKPYAGTQIANLFLSWLNNGYKTAGIWTFTDNLWPGSIETSGEFKNGNFLCGLMPNLMDSQVPYNTYYVFSMISRYCSNVKSVWTTDNSGADNMAVACVEDKEGNTTVFVVNSGSTSATFNLDFTSALGNEVLYRHMYNPQTFVADTAAKQIGVDEVLVNVDKGFSDTVVPGAVAVYTTSKK